MAKDSPWLSFMARCLSDLDSTKLDSLIEFAAMYADPTRGGALNDEAVDVARSLLRDVRVARINEVGHSLHPWKIAALLRDFSQR